MSACDWHYFTLRITGTGSSIRLGTQFAQKTLLEELCQSETLILVDHGGNELFPNSHGMYHLEEDEYTATSEEDLKRMEEGEETTEEEALRRMQETQKRLKRMEEVRKKWIKERYKAKHPHLWTFNEDFLEETFIKAVKSGQYESILRKESETGIYSLKVFTESYCSALIEEVEHFEQSGLPIMRPNSMNNYGVVLEELHFGHFFDALTKYIQPLTTALYSDVGSHLDSHHAFIVQYKISEDTQLGFHYDDSEVTLNVCLGKQFKGGNLFFAGLLEDPSTHKEYFEFAHEPGLGILHIGKHRHGAKSITEGERFNLIVWWRNSTFREKHHHCPHCQ